jgi:hypothetical protein
MTRKTKSGDSTRKKAGNGLAIGYEESGGNMGAGRSGKENLGSEKPSDDKSLGSQKPKAPSKKK